jgi:hypothetical protein
MKLHLVEAQASPQAVQRVPGLLPAKEAGAAEARLVRLDPLDGASAAQVLHHDFVQELPALLTPGHGVQQVRRDVHGAPSRKCACSEVTTLPREVP